MGVLSAQGRRHREAILHVGPLRRGVQTGGHVAVSLQRQNESALQRRDVFPKFFSGFREFLLAKAL